MIVTLRSFEKIKVYLLFPYVTGLPRFVEGVDPIVRKGHPGGWREYFTAERKEYIQHKIDTIATPVGLKFKET